MSDCESNTLHKDSKCKASRYGNLKHLNIEKCEKESSMLNGGLSLSPTSPSSMFGRTCLACDGDCVVEMIILSYWDNILGPKIKHVWMMDKVCDPNMDVLTHVATHTLSGEIYQYGLEAELNTKFYSVTRHDITVAAFVFSAMAKGDMTVHSVSLVLPRHRYDIFLCWHSLCQAWMTRLIGKLRVLLAKETDDTAVRLFSVDLSEFVRMIGSLTSLALPRHIPLSITSMHREHKCDVSLLRQAITSHLSTCGRSVVVGRSVDQINLMVCAMAMFLSPEERRCCRYVSCDNPLPYHPDVCVQGILQSPDGTDSLKDMVFSQYPTTMVNLTMKDIKLTSLPHEHYLRRSEALRQELVTLWKGQVKDSYPTSEMLQPFDDPETLVGNLLEELVLLPGGIGVQEAYILEFLRLLEKKALALIEYIEMLSDHGQVPVKHKLKKLKHDLSLTVPGDFKMVLATAEKLRPGICVFICGSPRSDTPDLF